MIFQSLPAHGNAALEMVATTGGASTILAAQEANMNNTAWSPDSKTIATTLGLTPERERLVLIDVATRSVRVVATGTIQGVSFSPDSTQLAYARAPNLKTFPAASDIHTVPVAGGTPKRAFLLSGPAPLAWSASGAQLLAQFGGQDTIYGEAVNPLTGAVHTLSAKKSIALQLVAAGISRDGSTVLAATGGFDPGSGHNIVSVPFAGGPITTLVRNGFAPSWNR